MLYDKLFSPRQTFQKYKMSQKGSACSWNLEITLVYFFGFNTDAMVVLHVQSSATGKCCVITFFILILPITWHVSMHTIFSAHSHWCQHNYYNIHAIRICLNIKTHLFHDSIIHGSELPTTIWCSVSSAHELFHDQTNVKQCVLVPRLNMLKSWFCTWMDWPRCSS